MRTLPLLAVLFAAGLSLAACTATSTRSTHSASVPGAAPAASRPDLAAIRQQVAELKDQSRLAELRGGPDVLQEVGRLRQQAQELSVNLSSVGGTEGQSLRQQVDYVSARLDQLERNAARMASEVSPEPAAGTENTAPPALTSYPGQAPPPEPTPEPFRTVAPPPAQTASLPPKSSGPYEEGKARYDQRNYSEAIDRFKGYLAAEPKGPNAAAAQFYIGEANYAQQRYEEAILEYQKVVRGFPKSSQVSTSLLKQGLSFQALGDQDSARLLYQKVIRDHPKSYAAGVARDRLAKL